MRTFLPHDASLINDKRRLCRLSTTFSMLLVIALVAGSLLSSPAQAMGVVAFDYGTEWMKVSLVKPGLPFDVVLDRDSKRKIQSAVSFKKWGLDEEILFGTNAYNHATREPKQSFYGLKTLLGRTTSEDDQEYVDLYSSIFGNDVISSDRVLVRSRGRTRRIPSSLRFPN